MSFPYLHNLTLYSKVKRVSRRHKRNQIESNRVLVYKSLKDELLYIAIYAQRHPSEYTSNQSPTWISLKRSMVYSLHIVLSPTLGHFTA